MATTQQLVQTNSVNPSLDPGGPGELEIASYVISTLRSLGLEVRLLEPRPQRASVVGLLKGSGAGPSLMLNGHFDTVAVGDMEHPFCGEYREGRIYGRGAYDMKGSVAACMSVMQALAKRKVELKGDVLLSAVADEEFESLGTSRVVRSHPVDACIVTEPTALKVCLAHKGFAWIEVTTLGEAAHGSRFQEGIDANMRMGRFLSRLEKLGERLLASTPHELVGPPSLHASVIRGGTGWSTYSDRCTLQIERRTVPGETSEQVTAEFQSILDELKQEDPSYQASIRTVLWRDPFEVNPEERIVKAVERAAGKVLNEVPERVGETPWMDSALFASAGIPTVVIGPSGAGAHADVEWVDFESLCRLSEILLAAVLDFCG